MLGWPPHRRRDAVFVGRCALRCRVEASGCPLRVDAVEKVENRTTPKISQMVIFGLLRRCDAL